MTKITTIYITYIWHIDCLSEGWNGDLFTIYDNKQILSKDGTSGSDVFDGMWEVKDKHNPILNIK